MTKRKQLKSILAIAMAAALLAFSGCQATPASSGDESPSKAADSSQAESDAEAEAGAPALTEGKDTNNGRPYNLQPVKYDSRQDKYLNGINATVLPITEEPVEITVWRQFTSTVMQGLDESEVFKEMEKRTGVKVKWIYPPVGSEADNFTLRVSSGDLPHVFSCPPAYPGGIAKAVSDEVYVDLTPYYDKGLMPNLKYLRDNNPQFDKDFKDDEGRTLAFAMIDVVPSSPWSGAWVRQDWMDELGLSLPETIADWDTMLRAMKEKTGSFPLAVNVKDFIKNSYLFAGAYGSSFQTFINKDGTVAYGSVEPGYEEFLKLLNTWYTDGLLDPDFTTRKGEDYNANVANGAVGAFAMNYGEIGQQKLTGTTLEPKYKLTPVLNPVKEKGDVIHLSQNNAIVRADRDFLTVKALDDGLDELIVKWKDYWYSQDGGDLCSYGVEGLSYEWDDSGEINWTYPALTETKDADFWTLYPKFKVHNFGYLRDSTAYDNEPEVQQCIDLWSTQAADWLMPDNIALTADEAKEMSNIMTDIETYVEEMTYKFITGQTPLTEYGKYVAQIEQMNIARAVEIQQAALDRYNKR